MYRTIESRLAFLGVSKKKLAHEIGMSYNTFLLKLKGKSNFTLDEAEKIKLALKSKLSIEELFFQGELNKEEY